MTRKHLNHLFAAVVAASLFSTALPAFGDPLSDAIDALPDGTEYRVLTVTSTKSAATSNDIATYNTFVQDAAAAGSATAPLGLTWQALASTTSTNAVDNVGLSNTDTTPVVIFNTFGEVVATSGADLWDGVVSAFVAGTENGLSFSVDDGCLNGVCTGIPNDPLGDPSVWTGTNVDGTVIGPLGSTNPHVGATTRIDSIWIYGPFTPGFFRVNTSGKHLYGLSSSGVSGPAGPVKFSGNQHYYEFVPSYGISWEDAKTAAAQRSHMGLQGYVATATTQAEDDFIHNSFSSQILAEHAVINDAAPQAWLGGFAPGPHPSPDPSLGWEWITGEDWLYAGWGNGEPNGGTSSLDNVATIDLRPALVGWNDTFADTPGVEGYIVEYNNDPPTANAGPDQSIHAGDTVQLDGSASSDDNTPTASLMYAWSFSLRPGGSLAVLIGDTTVSPTFVADLPGDYKVELIVTDDAGANSVADKVKISSENLAPTADAGEDVLAITGTAVLLDGSGSMDPEGDLIEFFWTLTGKPAGSMTTLGGKTTETPSLTPDLKGLYTVELVVSDFWASSAAALVEVDATTAGNFAEMKIQETHDFIKDLPISSFTKKANKKKFQKRLRKAVRAIQQDKINKAKKKIEKAIKRTDGCSKQGYPDGQGKGRDWIKDCSNQVPVKGKLDDALDALNTY